MNVKRPWRTVGHEAFVLLVAMACVCLLPRANPQRIGESAVRETRAAQPKVLRVEPPNWWVGLKPDLMLLITGESLEGMRAKVDYPGVKVVRSKAQPGGRYLFLWLDIDASAKPGEVSIVLERNGAKAQTLAFPLRAREPTAGKFQGFGPDDVIYLIMPDRFADGDLGNDPPAQAPGTFDRGKARAYHGGDLRGVREHLDYLRDLGVTTVWLTPVVANDNRSPESYHGYGAVDEYDVDGHFGTMKDLQQLVGAAHQKGMKIVLDVVPNHIGPGHPWVAAPPEPDWFHGTKEHHTLSTGEFHCLVDPHAPPRYWRALLEGWFANILPDMNQENPHVAQYLIQNALWWAEETGVDGYRLDTFPYVSRSFWSEFHCALKQAYPRFTTVGEVFNPNPVVTSFFVGGRLQDGIDTGVNTVFDFPLATAVHEVVLQGKPAERFVQVLGHDRLYPHPELLVPFFGNHDVPRFASAPGSSPERLRLAFSILLTMRGIPEMYYGDEIGMTGGGDPDNRRDFPGGFPGDLRNAFTPAGRTKEEQAIFSHVQRLLRLRRDDEALRRGQLWHIGWDQQAYAFARITKDERLLVVFNRDDKPHSITLKFGDTPLAGAHLLEPLLGGRAETVRNDEVELKLPGVELQIYSVQ